MFTLMVMAFLAVIGGVVVLALATVAFFARFAVHAVLLPFKLLLLPFVAIFVIVKLAILFTVGVALVALLVPLAILFGLVALPFAIASAIF